MIKDFCLHKTTYKQFLALISDLILGDARYRVNVVKWQDRRTIPMNATWRMWMQDMAMQVDWFIPVYSKRTGKKIYEYRADAQLCHELYVTHFAGTDEHGNRIKTSKMDKGEMLDMMNRFQAFAIMNGFKLKIPEDCEYMQMRDAV